jgi:hypothetical protein
MQTKNNQTSSTLLKYSSRYGIILFTILALGQLLSTILIFSRRPDLISNGRVIAVFVGMVGSSLLPPLVTYLLGFFTAAKNSTPYLRQFNGVVSGLAAFWLSHALSTISFRMYIPRLDFMPLQVHQFGYAIIATLTIAIIWLCYRRVPRSQPLLYYKPLVIILAGSLLAWTAFNFTGGPAGSLKWYSEETRAVVLMGLSVVGVPLLYLWLSRSGARKGMNIFNTIVFMTLCAALLLVSVEVIQGLAYVTGMVTDDYRYDTLVTLLAYPIAFVAVGIYMRALVVAKATSFKATKARNK